MHYTCQIKVQTCSNAIIPLIIESHSWVFTEANKYIPHYYFKCKLKWNGAITVFKLKTIPCGEVRRRIDEKKWEEIFSDTENWS